MGRTISIGAQGFAKLREGGFFYVDKTGFIREWWDAADEITLVCRPRRFGKTLNMSMLECFLSVEYAGRGEELFGELSIWEEERFRELQGTVPVGHRARAHPRGRPGVLLQGGPHRLRHETWRSAWGEVGFASPRHRPKCLSARLAATVKLRSYSAVCPVPDCAFIGRLGET